VPKTWIRLIVTLCLVGGFGGALYFAVMRTADQKAVVQQTETRVRETMDLTGLIALDVETYLKDARVQKILADNKLRINVTRIGSRDMAARVASGQAPDFLFPSGVVAANQITDAAKNAKLNAQTYAPFYTPMVMASWLPIAKVLEANGIAKELRPKVYGADLSKLTQLMLAKTRWNELKQAQDYNVGKSVLVSTTDVRRSNSAAQYLALASYAIHGDMVTDRATAQKIAKQAAELFKRQGYQENYVNGNFDDYVGIGIGKAPLAFIYENQMMAYALAQKGVKADMALIYPQPTIFNKVVFVAMNEKSKALGELLVADANLQRIAVDYGFRIGNAQVFNQAAKDTGLAIEERLTQIIDPPSHEIMTEMIDTITREMAQ
jgi:hypothetical protein